MGRLRKKKMHVNNKAIKKRYRTKRRTKDLDQIMEDMEPAKAQKLAEQPRDQDLPGEGQHYCLHCARYFINEEALTKHFKSKLHKRRLSALRKPVYTHKEAEMAAGMGHYILPPPPLDVGMKQLGTGTSPAGMGISSRTRPEGEGENGNDINDFIQVNKQLKTLTVS